MKRSFTVLLSLSVLLAMSTLVPSSANSKIQLIQAVKLPEAVGVGEKIRVTPAKWSKQAKSTFTWFIGSKSVKTSTSLKFKVSPTYAGKKLRVKESAQFGGGITMTTRSFPLTIGEIKVLSEPSLMFSDSNLSAATLTLPEVRPKSATVEIEWFKNDALIEGANDTTYVFRRQDSGTLLSAGVRLKNVGYSTTELRTEGLEVPTSFEAETELLWADEFNASEGVSPLSSTWVPQNGDGTTYGIPGWGNGEMQWYLWEQAKHDGTGNLVIRATRTGAGQYDCYYAGNCQWISSKLVTLGKLHVKYGRISIRLKSAQGAGTWPAFWTLGTNINQVGWPRCGEIDVVELAGKTPFTVWGTPHGPISAGPGNGGSTQLLVAAHQQFHTYTVDWYPDRIVWYLDSKPYYTFRKSENEADWVFDDWQYLILNLAMGGGFGGSIDPNLTDAQIEVDWVRVYRVNGYGQISTP